MKELQDIVCDLEYAEKLRDLGVKKPTLFSWDGEGDICCYFYYEKGDINTYTATELMEMLPSTIKSFELSIFKNHDNSFCCAYSNHKWAILDADVSCDNIFVDNKLPNAIAKLLIWCLENGYINPNEVNKCQHS